MYHCPFEESLLQEGERLIKEGLVKQILFSEGTYQVEVQDAKEGEPLWPFLQLDDIGHVLDCFCTCKEAETFGQCVHLAAAFLKIFHEKLQPLHVRFRHSLWNILMQMAAKRHGYEVACLRPLKERGYYAESLSKKKLFMISPLTKKGEKQLNEIVLNRVLQTEETSLKFSNLSSEELSLWREGKPSHLLQYELSFWSDLGKWLMVLDEQGLAYQIDFFPAQKSLPKELTVSFREVSVSFYIAEVNWEEIVPALASMKSSIPIYPYQNLVFDQIIYDQQKKVFLIDTHQVENDFFPSLKEDAKSHVLGGWIFHPDVGFYAKEVDELLKHHAIPSKLVSEMLMRHSTLLQKYLVNTKICLEMSLVSYQLYFDQNHNFHVEAYLFDKGDLQKEHSTQFGPWMFIQDQGFYQLGGMLFHEIHKVIPKERLSAFVSQYKMWLNQYEGFQTHLTHIECYLTYGVSENQELYFYQQSQPLQGLTGILDLEEWVYIEGRGFYEKASSKLSQVIVPGLKLAKDNISPFIKTHEEDLEMIEGFFSGRQPIEKSGLEVVLNENYHVIVRPKVFFSKGYSFTKVRFFGEYSYVVGEGFSLLPKAGRIPEKYQEEVLITDYQEQQFLLQELPLLKPFILDIDPRLKTPKRLVLKVRHIAKHEDATNLSWGVDLAYLSEHGEVQIKTLWEAIKTKKQFLKTPAGLLDLHDMRFSWLREVSGHQFMQETELALSSLEWMRLILVEKLQPPTSEDVGAENSLQFLQEIQTLQTADLFDLEGLTSCLRPYQEKGVQWLWFLYSYGLSGLLCDEMGLGKTHQAMAILAASMNAKRSKNQKFLVVCPTSVIYHWEELLKRFLPNARVFMFYGVQRCLKGFQEQGDILLTSYGILRSEKDLFSEMAFEITIFDELQVAKNAGSQIHKVLKTLKTRMKIGLTGTPIENHLMELHSLFDIILPNYLPSEAAYKELFITGIEKHQDVEKKQILTKMVHPFILRRKKEEVLQDLPEKTEEIAYVDLSDEQKRMYKEACEKQKERIFSEMQEGQLPYMHVFALFNALKQICDHPALVNKDIENYEKYASGKWDLFVELLQEARDSGQKVVVFSQYLKMLDIIEMYLKRNHIGYAQIRGSTKWRKEEMRRFKEDPACEVFIGSLQAAGVGIELVSASVVIHYDRWWNPAKENQATDRVHRIGQNRGVQVFKLVSKETIEEHIHSMIERKLYLVKEIIGYDDQYQIKNLNKEELLGLLKSIENYM